MLSVIIATEGQESPVVRTLATLVPGVTAGLVHEVLLVDRTGNDVIARVADVSGCGFLRCEGPRAAALAAGARQARSSWLMFLHPGTIPALDWIDETAQFIERMSAGDTPRAAVFRYARSPYAASGWRSQLTHVLRLVSGPRPDQGLIIARAHFERLGGYAPDARHAEAELLRKLGRARLTLNSPITVRE